MARKALSGRILLLGSLLLAFLLTPAAARTGNAPTEPAISPEQAIVLATGGESLSVHGEVGDNDFRISDMGGDQDYDASQPAAAYNSRDHQYLVVWEGDDGALTTDGEIEVFGQRLDAATGAEIGPDFRISHVGDDGNPTREAHNPAVAYNSADNQYLVVWEGDEPRAGAFEIHGRRIEGDTGNTIGDEFRISEMGAGDEQIEYDAYAPAVAYNSTDSRYLVVWHGDDGGGPLADDEFEIWGQVIRASDGAELGTDFRISDMGGLGNTFYDAHSAAVAFNPSGYEYLVVWSGCDTTCDLSGFEKEIYGQRLNANDLSQIGNNDFRISHMGPAGNHRFDAYLPAVAYNGTEDEYLVVWEGDDNTPPLIDNDFEIFGRRIYGDLADGDEIGADHFRISYMGGDVSSPYYGLHPDVVYSSKDNQYLVAWEGYDCQGACSIPLQYEVFGQRLDADGNKIGDAQRISDSGTYVAPFDAYSALVPALAYNPRNNEYLVAWEGDDNIPPLADDEFEIFGQRLEADGGEEIGANDFRISNMGPPAAGITDYGGHQASVAYNPTTHQYLVVWEGDDNTPPLVNQEYEVFGQLIDASSGAEIGANDFRISSMGPDGNSDYGAFGPDVSYNSTDNEYLVVWYGGNLIAEGVPYGEMEVYGQLLDAEGDEIGTDDFRISVMGPDLDLDYGAYDPAVAYSSADNKYLVVWSGDDNTPPLVNNKSVIFGQLLDANGNEVEDDDFQVSEMGPDNDADYDASRPDVAYNPTGDQYLVVWHGVDDLPGLAKQEYEVFGQRIEAATGNEIGDDIRISSMGPDGDAAYGAYRPAVAYDSTDNQNLVVWYGRDDTPPLAGENEIFGQLLDEDGNEVGADDFIISDMGPDGNLLHNAFVPAVAYSPSAQEFLVVWYGDDAEEENEIYGQRLTAGGDETGENDLRLSDMGPDGDSRFGAALPALASTLEGNQFLVAWQGDDDEGELIDDEFEIFGQRYEIPTSYVVFLPIILRE